MAAIDCTTALSHLGRSANFVQFLPAFEGPELIEFRGRIMAVQVPAPGTGVECALLIEFEGLPRSRMDFVDIDTVVGFSPS